MDPYQILMVKPTDTTENIQRAYEIACKLYHTRGGSTIEFNKITTAYNEIIRHRQMQNNTSASTSNDDADGYMYNVDDSVYRERTLAEYERERSQITAEAESMTKMFNSGFNNNAFNRMFEQQRELHGQHEEVPDEPEPLHCNTHVAYSDLSGTKVKNGINPNDLDCSDLSIYDKYHRNPKEYNQKAISELARQPDITKETPLDVKSAQSRVKNYTSMQVANPRGPAPTAAFKETASGIDHSKLMELRQTPEQLRMSKAPATATASASFYQPQMPTNTYQLPLQQHANMYQPLQPLQHANMYQPMYQPQQLPMHHQLPQTVPTYVPPQQMYYQQTPTPTPTPTPTHVGHHRKNKDRLQELEETVKLQQKLITGLLKKKN